MIGFLIILSMKSGENRNYFDIKALLITGCIPAAALILYKTGLVDLVVTRLFNSDLTVSELAFYFFSRETVWAIWLGISVGASIRLKLRSTERHFKHQIKE